PRALALSASGSFTCRTSDDGQAALTPQRRRAEVEEAERQRQRDRDRDRDRDRETERRRQRQTPPCISILICNRKVQPAQHNSSSLRHTHTMAYKHKEHV